MERRTALAVAATGALLSATGVVGVHGMLASGDPADASTAAPAGDMASVGASPDTTTPLDPVTVTETRDVFDLVVVPTSPPAPVPPPALAATPPASALPVSDSEEDSDVEMAAESTATAPPSTTPTTAPRKAPSTTTTTRPSSPPMPPGCIDGQLEDNGTWNCQSPEHDD